MVNRTNHAWGERFDSSRLQRDKAMLPVKVSANEREKGFVKRKMNKGRYRY